MPFHYIDLKWFLMNVKYALCTLLSSMPRAVFHAHLFLNRYIVFWYTQNILFNRATEKFAKKIGNGWARRMDVALWTNTWHKSNFDTTDNRKHLVRKCKEFTYSRQTHRNWNLVQQVEILVKAWLLFRAFRIWFLCFSQIHFCISKMSNVQLIFEKHTQRMKERKR